MRGSRGLAVVLAWAATLVFSRGVSAHRADDYLQAARIDLEPDRVVIALDLTPGIAVSESSIASIDLDGDGALSASEQRSYAEQVLSAVEVDLDEGPLQPHLLSSSFPEVRALRRGEGAIRLSIQASHPRVSAGSHHLFFRNTHLAGQGAYLANALVPESARVTVTAQRRNFDQSELTIEYVLQADSARAALPWALSALAAAFLTARFRPWSRSGEESQA